MSRKRECPNNDESSSDDDNFNFDMFVDALSSTNVFGCFAEKGGTGKSSTTHSIATYVSSLFKRYYKGSDIKKNVEEKIKKHKVLVIDADPQNNIATFSSSPAFVSRSNKMNLMDLLKGSDKEIYENPVDGYDIILGSRITSDIQVSLDNEMKSEMKHSTIAILNKLKQYSDIYGLILIDFNPTYSSLNKILMSYCDSLIYVYQCDIMCLQSTPQLLKELKEINAIRNKILLRVKLWPNNIRYKSNEYVKPYGKVIELMQKSCQSSELVKTVQAIPRCETLSKSLRDLEKNIFKTSNYSAQSFQGYFESIKNTFTQVLYDDGEETEDDNWEWKQIDYKSVDDYKDHWILYFTEFSDCYKIGISRHFRNRLCDLLRLEIVRNRGNKKNKEVIDRMEESDKVLALFISDEDTIYSVEQVLHRQFYHFSTMSEYYRKEFNIKELIAQLNDSTFVLELACSYLK